MSKLIWNCLNCIVQTYSNWAKLNKICLKLFKLVLQVLHCQSHHTVHGHLIPHCPRLLFTFWQRRKSKLSSPKEKLTDFRIQNYAHNLEEFNIYLLFLADKLMWHFFDFYGQKNRWPQNFKNVNRILARKAAEVKCCFMVGNLQLTLLKNSVFIWFSGRKIELIWQVYDFSEKQITSEFQECE